MRNDSFNCDAVASMEAMGVGVEEILQYARAIFPRREIHMLTRALGNLLQRPATAPFGLNARDELVKPVADAVSDHAY